jgi:succinyl-diaminopimelate desuccinylase
MEKLDHLGEFTIDSAFATLVTRGKSAHGSAPQFGVNAILQMIEILGDVIEDKKYIGSEIHQTLLFIQRYIRDEHNGHSLGIACSDEVTGALIVNMGMFHLDSKQSAITLNIRHPASTDQSFVIEGLTQIAREHHFELANIHYMPPVYVPPTHPLIAKLSKAHETIMGQPPDLVTTPGGTYAKWLNNQGVGYGGVWTEGYAHQADERIRIDEWMTLSRIITQAAFEISQ